MRDEVPGLGSTIGDELLRPHRSYFGSVYPLLQEMPQIHALAHITGGGLYENLPRVVPSDVQVLIDRRSWSPLPIFRLLQDAGSIPDAEMYRAFNMGIGMVALVDRDLASAVVQRLNQAGESAAIIGSVQKGPNDVQIV